MKKKDLEKAVELAKELYDILNSEDHWLSSDAYNILYWLEEQLNNKVVE